MNDQDTDKGEVGSSSLPRPTSFPAGVNSAKFF